jgi:hypothetical protein
MGGAGGRGGIDAAVDGNPSDANRTDTARADTDALVSDASGLDVSADVGTSDALIDRGGEPGVDATQDSWVPDGVVADINTGIDADPDRRGSTPDGGPIVGVYYNIIAQHSGKCMTVLGNLPFDGTNIVQFACDGSSSQRFRLQAVSASSYIIVHPFSNKCVDVAESGTADGTNVNLYTCNNTMAQLYGLKLTESPGFYTIVNPNSGKCIDVDGARQADLANIQIFTCNGALNQAWEFIDVTKDQ